MNSMAASRRVIEMLLCMSLLVMMRITTMAQQTQQYPETSTSSSCSNVLLSLSPCLDYITGSASTPSSGCCSQLAYVVGSQPQCLCEVVNGGASSIAATLNINQTQALGLPNACRVQTPPITICSSATGSVSPPASVYYAPSIPNSPAAGIGSTIISSTNGGVGGGSFRWNSSSTAKLPSLLLVMFFFATTLSLTFTFTTIT
ncbi:hypothetical protein HN51_015441 [Arachis hypogaea]|uniref:Bifunctional inhibitor/plant lipid transfer protein/seed storage helical domain-containing protein n=1 Tax=Arachis hypogaea TaxID=3818 RepID=A0A445CKN0_ARAHY|nr:non-specific lipid-transfer protein-like protein At2g13820 [Arachis hypogaea]QHO45898.1 Non-specific lipid-transfer protein-like protein [Arachis hypogaea]RYR51452.1 hypothetical protein Ahy_A06g026468 [Arachis hypogaea]